MRSPNTTLLFVIWFNLSACQVNTPPPDEDSGWDDTKSFAENCFPEHENFTSIAPDYDQYNPVYGRHCAGTAHQEITGIEKIVFLGDSITAGTPPTPEEDYYRNQLVSTLQGDTDSLEVVNCAQWGARTDDILSKPHEQLLTCVPQPESKPTLIVMTVGGNDMFEAAKVVQETGDTTQAAVVIDRTLEYFEEAITWMRDNESTHFPGGLFVVFSNIYEYTDATGNMSSCPAASALGFGAQVPELAEGYIRVNEEYLRIAVETNTDVVFLLEHFCGHGFESENPDSPCYIGPETEVWFDGTCIHPNPLGHQKISELFARMVVQ